MTHHIPKPFRTLFVSNCSFVTSHILKPLRTLFLSNCHFVTSHIPKLLRTLFFLQLQLCDQIQALREANIQVIDLKTDNVLLGDNNDVRIIDLGMARFVGTSKIYPIDAEEARKQCPHMAPELFSEHKAHAVS